MLIYLVKKLLDWIEPLIEASDIQPKNLDRSVVGPYVLQIKQKLQNVKKQLDVCTKGEDAVLISRIIRAIQKALKDKIISPIKEIDFDVTESQSSKTKIEIVQDSLEFSFPLCDKLVKGMADQVQNNSTPDADAMLIVDLLGLVIKVFL